MAVTAAIVMSSATGTAPALATATLTITNGNATACNVLAVRGMASPTGATAQSVAVQCGEVGLGPGATTSVAGSNGTLVLPFKVLAFAPFMGSPTSAPTGSQSSADPSPANPSSFTYDIGAIIQTNATGSDAFVTATTATYAISAPSSH